MSNVERSIWSRGGNFTSLEIWKNTTGTLAWSALTSSSICLPKDEYFSGLYLAPISPGFIFKTPLLEGVFNISFVGKTSFDLGFNLFDSSISQIAYPPIQTVSRSYVGVDFFFRSPIFLYVYGFGYYIGATIVPDPFLVAFGMLTKD